jgi:hypothetical protein
VHVGPNNDKKIHVLHVAAANFGHRGRVLTRILDLGRVSK